MREMRRYNLSSSQSDRIAFDEMVARYATQMLRALFVETALCQTPEEYARVAWEQFEIGLDEGNPSVDDREEAHARFLDVFQSTVRDWQADKLEELSYTYRQGDRDTILVALDEDCIYDQIEVLALEPGGVIVAYRSSADTDILQYEGWKVGTMTDVLKEMQVRYAEATKSQAGEKQVSEQKKPGTDIEINTQGGTFRIVVCPDDRAPDDCAFTFWAHLNKLLAVYVEEGDDEEHKPQQ